jgi:hypothetical protein
MFGKEVALILCGEAHEDTIDLTRRKGNLEPDLGWIMVPPSLDHFGFNPKEAVATKKDVTLLGAKEWAEELMEKEDDKDNATAGAKLVFAFMGRTKGLAAVFSPRAKRSAQHSLPPGSVVYEWADKDNQAREFNRRRLAASVPVIEQDLLIAERKAERLADGFELFDDWLVRQFEAADVHMEFVQEAPVSADEVELHIEDSTPAAPCAHECLRLIDLDSDEDEDDEPHLGSGCYLDYLRRQTTTYLPQNRIHGIDPRVLGDAEDENLPEFLRGSFQQPRFQAPGQKDTEMADLDAQGADWGKLDQEMDVLSTTLPSFEAWLGGAADLLYHAPHIKADYSPFLASCVGSTERLWQFFEALYFGTVPEALSKISIDNNMRSFASVRSLAYRSAPDAKLMRRPLGKCSDRRRPIPVRALPMERYLKARGFNTPRTWISGLAEQLRLVGAEHLVNVAKAFYREAVNRMLVDPKGGDLQGDNFVAWLRACHRDVFKDVDKSDPRKLQRKDWVRSQKHPTSTDHEYFMKSICIPGFQEAFSEIVSGRRWNCSQCGEANAAEQEVCGQCSCAPSEIFHKASTVQQRMLSKIIVDAFALRSVDLAMILKIANLISSAPADEPVVVMLCTLELITQIASLNFGALGALVMQVCRRRVELSRRRTLIHTA